MCCQGEFVNFDCMYSCSISSIMMKLNLNIISTN